VSDLLEQNYSLSSILQSIKISLYIEEYMKFAD